MDDCRHSLAELSEMDSCKALSSSHTITRLSLGLKRPKPAAGIALGQVRGERNARASTITSKGFTLIEILVVLVVLAIAASSVRYVIATHLEREADSQVDRLRLALQAAADYGLTRGQMVRFELGSGHYRFMVMNLDGSWSPYRGVNRLLQAHDLPDTLRVNSVRVDAQSTDTLVFRSRAPVFDIEGESSNGLFVIKGSATGSVQLARGAE